MDGDIETGVEYTLALIKPDAVASGKAQEMQQLIEMSGFLIIAKRQLQLTNLEAEQFYAEHKGKPFFSGLVEFMTSGRIVAMVLAKANAVKAWRELMGPTNVFDARLKAPRSLRALYGSDGTRNACHGSDSPASAAREIKFYFPNLQLFGTVQDGATAQAYIAEQLKTTLVKGLTVLAREKPTSNKLEAITFLANWMLDNNPNKPKTVVPPELQDQVKEQQARRQAAGDATRTVVPLQQSACRAPRLPIACTNQQTALAAVVHDERHIQDEAATKVQAAFRGHQARKHVAEMKEATNAVPS